MEESGATKISLSVHSLMGIVAGYVTVLLVNPLYGVGAAIGLLLATGYATEFVLKKKGIKWWMANGGVMYIIIWIVVWTIFLNGV